MTRIVGIDRSRLSPDLLRDIRDLLSPAERRCLAARPEGRREEWTVGRLALKLAGGWYGRKPWHGVDTTYDSRGRPCIPGHPSLSCSLSHSGHLVVAAVGSAPIGVDIERIRPRHQAMIGYVAGSEEVDLVSSFRTAAELVTRVWTIKEAALKSGGWGLRIPPRAARIRRRKGASSVDVSLRWQAIRWRITVWSISTRGASLSIATDESNPLPRIRWNPHFDLPAG